MRPTKDGNLDVLSVWLPVDPVGPGVMRIKNQVPDVTGRLVPSDAEDGVSQNTAAWSIKNNTFFVIPIFPPK